MSLEEKEKWDYRHKSPTQPIEKPLKRAASGFVACVDFVLRGFHGVKICSNIMLETSLKPIQIRLET